MKEFVLDCSVAMAWCFADEANSFTDAVLDQLSMRRAIVPSIWPLEVSNVLLGAIRRKRITSAQSLRFVDLLNHLPILADTVMPTLASGSIFNLGLQYQLSSYDASYLELALRRGFPLATQDAALKAAIKKSGGELFRV